MDIMEIQPKTDKKVLYIIEDDFFLVKTYQYKFTKEGFEVVAATNGKEITDMFAKAAPDLVMLDLMLPEISGFDLLEQIRKKDKWEKVPVIILTNLGQQEDIDRGMKLGANEYFIKSNVKIADIVEKVKGYLK